ncbi:MAG: DUF1295 domain-containing protein [Chloroflexota bacterium]
MLRRYLSPLFPFVLVWLLLIISDFRSISLVNGIAQLLLFAFVVCIPAWRTGRISYVDIGWPLGVALIGLITLLLADGYIWRKFAVSFAYLFIGLRMGIVALLMWRRGHLNRELPRYEYQRGRWERAGKTNVKLAAQVEVLMQGLANASFLAVPAFLLAHNPAPTFSPLEIIGALLWIGAFVLESVADGQKRKFLLDMKAKGLKKQVCNVGLWRYSRHPNYFAEWLVWTALVIAALPSWFALFQTTNIIIWGLLGFALLNVSRLLYITLVYHTGAVPAEFYSAQKRPGYKAYQQETNRFFPGPVKKID